MAHKDSINVALPLAVEKDLMAENIDVDTAFLYGEVKEESYIDQSNGFVDDQHIAKKCRLRPREALASRGRRQIFVSTSEDLKMNLVL